MTKEINFTFKFVVCCVNVALKLKPKDILFIQIAKGEQKILLQRLKIQCQFAIGGKIHKQRVNL